MLRLALIGGLSAALVPLAAPTLRAEPFPSAVGRISYGNEPAPGDAICSGVLVAADLVLTAAHCVRGAAGTPETIRFDAGWTGGRATARRFGAAVVLPGEADAPGHSDLQGDVALVVLSEGLPDAEVRPLGLAAPGHGPFTLVAFDRKAPDQPQGATLCRPLAKPPALLALDCSVVSGNSGAPLLQKTEGGWRVVAVMVASASGGPVRSWAVIPPSALLLRIAEATRAP